MFATLGVTRDKDRPHADFYQTPREATAALLRVERFNRTIWEPSCGDGAICDVLLEHGYQVVASDLYDRGHGTAGIDFLKDPPPFGTGLDIIMNPPFSLAVEFVQRALTVGGNKVAVLGRLLWLESVRRKPFFEASPLARVHVFSRRLPFMHRTNGAEHRARLSAICFAWFIFERGHEGAPTLHFLDWKDE